MQEPLNQLWGNSNIAAAGTSEQQPHKSHDFGQWNSGENKLRFSLGRVHKDSEFHKIISTNTLRTC